MALVNAYTSVTALKTRLGDIPDDVDNDALEQVINAASRAIDGMTGRTFYPVTETRYLTALNYELLHAPDLLTVTTLKTDEDGDGVYETTIAAADFDLVAAGEHYATIRLLPSSTSEWLPVTRRRVEVTGEWGYAITTPYAVEEACLLYAQRLFRRKNAPEGLIGTTSEFGTRMVSIPDVDPDVTILLKPYIRKAVIV